MTGRVLLRQVRSGERTLQFRAAVLAAATTQRPGAPRWTELTVYRLPRTEDEDPPLGGYVVAKVGRSVVAHKPDCPKADGRRMARLGGADEEVGAGWVPCLVCMPQVGVGMSPTTLLERSRFAVLQARNPEALYATLLQGRPGQVTKPQGAVAEVIRQLADADETFGIWLHQQQSVVA